jgi:hypothetical protein
MATNNRIKARKAAKEAYWKEWSIKFWEKSNRRYNGTDQPYGSIKPDKKPKK